MRFTSKRFQMNNNPNSVESMITKYDLICDYRVNDRLNVEKYRKSKQKYIQVFLRFIYFLYYSVCLLSMENGKLPKYYFDVVQYFASNTQYIYVIGISLVINSCISNYILNFNDKHSYEWLKIIKWFQNYNIMSAMGMTDWEEFRQFRTRILFLCRFLNILTKYSIIGFAFVLTITLVNILSFVDFLIYGIISISIMAFVGHLLAHSIPQTFFLYYIVCDFCRIRFKIYNKIIKNRISHINCQSNISIKKVIIENHNNICNEIIYINKLWSQYYLAVIFTTFPTNILSLYQILFGNINDIFLVSCFYLIFSVIFIFDMILNLMTSAVNKEANKSFHNLYKFHIKSSLKLNEKIKVWISIEKSILSDIRN